MATQEPSIVDLIKGALQDAQDLVRSEIALAKAEARAEMRRLGAGAALFAGAALAGLIALVFLLTTLAWAISDLFDWPAWAGFGIVTLLLLVAAGTLAYLGRARLAEATPMRLTKETVKENLEWMRARTS